MRGRIKWLSVVLGALLLAYGVWFVVVGPRAAGVTYLDAVADGYNAVEMALASCDGTAGTRLEDRVLGRALAGLTEAQVRHVRFVPLRNEVRADLIIAVPLSDALVQRLVLDVRPRGPFGFCVAGVRTR